MARRIERVMVETSIPGLFFVPCGKFASNGSELFLGPSADAFLKQVKDRFDYVLVDSAPVFAADDATSLAPKMDSVIFVVRSRYTRAALARKALDALYQRQAKVLGLVFNRVQTRARDYYHYKYSEYYGSRPKTEKG
jgi:succinoglycan biosynthesis transport protein ExoP